MDTSLTEAELYEKYKHLIKFTIRKYFRKINISDYSDMCQAGSIGLIKAIRSFDPSKSCTIESWIIGGVKRYILEYVGRFYKYKCKTKVSYVEMENFLNQESDCPIEIDFNWQDISEINKRIIHHVFWDNMTYKEIGQVFKMSKQAIHQRYNQTMEQLKENNRDYEIYLNK